MIVVLIGNRISLKMSPIGDIFLGGWGLVFVMISQCQILIY